jgi:tRNA A37 threonylcarbamoyladenosine biosynthesis protein TsaE
LFSDAVYVSNKVFKELKGDLTLEDIYYLNQTLRTFGAGKHQEAREWAKQAKEKYNNKTSFDIRFKIDSKNQRRIQCALKLEELYKMLDKNVDVVNRLNLNNVKSSKRS